MNTMNTHNLFIALIFLTCLLLILVSGYILNHHYRRNRKTPVDVEIDPPEHQLSRPENLREHYDEQRLSHVTTVASSIELLPEIRSSTGSDHEESWLEGSGQVMDGDSRLETYEVLGVKDENMPKWNLRDGKKDIAEISGDEKEPKAEERMSLDDKAVERKE
jgi:hypothetical protein